MPKRAARHGKSSATTEPPGVMPRTRIQAHKRRLDCLRRRFALSLLMAAKSTLPNVFSEFLPMMKPPITPDFATSIPMLVLRPHIPRAAVRASNPAGRGRGWCHGVGVAAGAAAGPN